MPYSLRPFSDIDPLTNGQRAFRAAYKPTAVCLLTVFLIGLPMTSAATGFEATYLVATINVDKLVGFTLDGEDGWRAGFIRQGREAYFGRGCWSYDIDSGQLKCELPATLNRVLISRDGDILFGCLGDSVSKGFYLKSATGDRIKTSTCPMWSWPNGLHPNKTAVAQALFRRNWLSSVDLVSIFSQRTVTGPEFTDGAVYSFMY